MEWPEIGLSLFFLSLFRFLFMQNEEARLAENLSVGYRSRTDDVPCLSRALPENSMFGVLECCLSCQLPSGIHKASLVALVVKNPHANAGDITDMGSIPGSGRCLEKEGTATRYSILA